MTDERLPFWKVAVANIGSRALSKITGCNPLKISCVNGVAVRNKWIAYPCNDVTRNYEKFLIKSIRENVRHGDTVNLIGACEGVSTVVAARKAGNDGHVNCFEGDEAVIGKLEETLALNEVESIVEIRNVIVESNIDVYGTPTHSTLPAEDLPDCDILVMDCEGAELDILENMDVVPSTIIVETHGFLNSPTDDVRQKLESDGYVIEDIYDTDEGFEEEEDVDVLVAENCYL